MEPVESDRGGLEIFGLSKRYGDTVALASLDVVASPGRILGVAGPNGAGKSTLVKILAGEIHADGGMVKLHGEAWDPVTHRDLVAIVHQEPQVFPNLSVAQNVLVGREGGGVVVRGLDPAERSLLTDLGIDHVADIDLGTLPLATQQRTEIARSLARDAQIFLFDEPNSALTEEESADLFRRMRRLADAGKIVMLVSHRLQELVELSDSVAMVVDGSCRVVLEGASLTEERIAREMVVGLAAEEGIEGAAAQLAGPSILSVVNWAHRGGRFAGIDLEVRRGEILAVSGVEGSGARQLVRALGGFEPVDGHVSFRGESVRQYEDVIGAVSFVGADRATSIFPHLTISDNLVSRIIDRLAARVGAIDRSRVRSATRDLVERFRVKTDDPTNPIGSLSGGNQQKVAIAAALATEPQVLVLEEPTRGVDIGSRREIYRLLRQHAAQGEAIVLFCTEDAEMYEVADRIVVISRARQSGEIVVGDYDDIEAFAADRTALEAAVAVGDDSGGTRS